jgi:hypothetical protein
LSFFSARVLIFTIAGCCRDRGDALQRAGTLPAVSDCRWPTDD